MAMRDPAPAADPGAAVAVTRLSLTDFRSYRDLRLETDRRPVVLTGPNGAGKTNLLEALSYLTPGRGLRRARLAEAARHGGPGGWAVAARIEGPGGPVTVGTGLIREGRTGGEGERRTVRIDGAAAPGATALARIVGVQWLTPQMDRLFLEGPGARRRFLDRLVFGFDPDHAGRVAGYEKAMRQRTQVLRERAADDAWLSALEAQMAEHGVAVAAARRDAIERLERGLAESVGPFPRAALAVAGAVEGWLEAMPAVEAEGRFMAALRHGRGRDRESGAATEGPHRTDLLVRYAERDQPAALCSTGEQKALLIAIVLANARLEAARRGVSPILLLDEVAAHLDADRRAALLGEILALGGQAWLTGTDRTLFQALEGEAAFFTVRDATVISEES